jgi:hypothetical protein
MNQINTLLSNYELKKIAKITPKTIKEVCFYIDANLILGNITKAEQMLKKSELLLKEVNLYSFFIHTVLFARGEDQTRHLVAALEYGPPKRLGNEVCGVFYFYIGFYFLRRKIMNIALEYYYKSRNCFRDAKQESRLWKTNFNIFLCKSYIENFINFDDDFDYFHTLPLSAKESFSNFLVWMYLFRGKHNIAFKICESNQHNQISKDYLTYLEFVHKRKQANKITFTESPFSNALSDVIKRKKDFHQISKGIKDFKSSLKFMIYHSYLFSLFESQEYEKLISLHKEYKQSFQDDKTLVIQPFSILELVLYASAKIKKVKLQQETLSEIKLSEPFWIYERSAIKSRKINEELNRNKIYFDPIKKLIRVNKRHIDISYVRREAGS